MDDGTGAPVDTLDLSFEEPPFNLLGIEAWVKNSMENTGIPVDTGELFHHVLHAVALSERAEEVELEYMAYMPPLEIADPSGDGVIKFLLDRLGGK
ncbi:MAG: hypothetical protein KJ970_19240 [Candidatus Eisenbacteria bacterium]|uniref:Uncharacterized protein n=1 Tax=Eiseniibacteriota bacterium TaxID=2212470 RepID=A0A948W8U6_UNCEI|nr:hypothetical protein [Candidatus Eisenbacteria bacterium]MBU1949720.1 hypothetical protein [Candidatus Eisenbacteria bacterium]MBU2693056.1 hypothetical protein [Candidatus Eisenbacteria bacterium]